MRNRTTIKICIGMLAGIIMTTGCTKNFIEINTNPNESNFASPEALFAPSVLTIVNNNLNRGFSINNELTQVTVTNSDSREIHRYEIRNSESNNSWQNWYVQLTNIRNVYISAETTQQEGFETWQAMSLIMDAYIGSLLTDVYGDIPYSESNKGKEFVVAPKFDTQEEVYKQIFEKLEKANELLKLNKVIPVKSFNDDPIYPYSQLTDPAGRTSAEHWRRFGNSMYLRLLLRVSGKAELNPIQKIKEIVESNKANYPIFESNKDNANFNYTNVVPFVTQFYNAKPFDFNGNKGYSEFFINTLLEREDSRIAAWSTQATLGVYSGIQSGYPKGSIPELGSTLLPALATERLLGNIMNYSELQFILAEAALKGYIGGNVSNYYNRGIEASFNTWKAPLTASYFEQDIIKLNPQDDLAAKMEKIHIQRYYAMLFTDFQQWAEIRRTGHPVLPIGPGVGNNKQYPARLTYPSSTISFNRTNYLEAVARMGADDINTKVWWNK